MTALPVAEVIAALVRRQAGTELPVRLRVSGRLDFGPHYARTLSIWRDQFLARGPEIAALGFDEVFTRMWRFYLCYSEAGFRSGYLDVSQFTLERA